MLTPVHHQNFAKFVCYSSTFCKTTVCFIRNCSTENKMARPQWAMEKDIKLALSTQEKRKTYKINDYMPWDQLETWSRYVVQNKNIENKKHTLDDLTEWQKNKFDSSLNKSFADKVSLYKGDITKLEVDAIVNAANSKLRAGGGVDGAIHRAAGPYLQDECNTIGVCPTGEARITGGYNLPARYVIHTVGPQDGNAAKLESCYVNSFAFQAEYKIRTFAFPCISTGIYGFPNRLAAHIALRTARKALESNNNIDRIIFCTFMPVDVDIYETLMQMYFPVHEWNYNDGASITE